jgi:hypothetical protein
MNLKQRYRLVLAYLVYMIILLSIHPKIKGAIGVGDVSFLGSIHGMSLGS